MPLVAEYPVQLGVAYLFLVGYLVRTAFLSVRLPGTVGVMVSGFAFSYFMQGDIFHGREHLQELAFFLVLLTAGTEISLADIKPHIVLSAIVPAACEMLSVAVYAYCVLHWTQIESCILGTALFALGDGLVIPKMSEFGQQFPGHPLPRLVFIWAPLEASFALTLFGVMSGLAEPAGGEAVSVKLLVLANALRILATLGVGSLVGAAVGWIVSNRSRFGIPFTGSAVEAYLLLLSAALGCFGFSCSGEAGAVVPMGFASGSLFQPELMVIVIGCFFARVVDAEVLHHVEQAMGGVWVFGQLVLFSMLGSKTDVGIFAQLVDVLPVMAVGISVRFLAVLLTTFCKPRSCQRNACREAFAEAMFCFLSTLPRATIQGAVGQVPVTQRFFQHDPGRAHVQAFISVAARLYIVCLSVLGSVVLDLAGPWLLTASRGCGTCEDRSLEEGWTLKEKERLSLQHERASLALRGSLLQDGVLELAGPHRERSSSVLSGRSSRTSSKWVRQRSTASSAGRARFSSFTSMQQPEGRIMEEPDEHDELGEMWVDDMVPSSRPRTTSVLVRQRSSPMQQLEGRITEELDVLVEVAEMWVDGSFLEMERSLAASDSGLALAPVTARR